MNTPRHASDSQIAHLFDASSPARQRAPGPPEEFQGMTFEQWSEANAARIWQLMRAGDCRALSFDQLARALWAQL